jgi:hypothetical protein
VIPTGTNATGHDLFSIPKRDYHNDVGSRFSGEYVVFGLDLPNMEDAAFLMANAAGHGDNYSYYVTCDKISSALDLVLGQPAADQVRVGIYGISAGGYAAILGGICDGRIGAIAASGTNVFTSKSSDLLRIRRFETAFLYRYDIAEFPDLHEAMYGLFPRPVIMEINVHDTSGVYGEALANTQRVLDYYKLRNQSRIAYRVLIEDETCGAAWRQHCMEVTGVKKAFDALFRKI